MSLTYELQAAPAGATISASGVIGWTSALEHLNTAQSFKTVVRDNGSPAMSATNEFTVFVGPIHNGPSIAASIQAAVNEGGQLNLTNPASSTDIPQLGFSYQLVGAPQGAAVDGNGVIAWVPTEAQGPSTNLFEMVVTDSGTPPLSATSMVQIVVAEVNTAPTLPAQTDADYRGVGDAGGAQRGHG